MGIWRVKKIKVAKTFLRKLLSEKQGYKCAILLRSPQSAENAKKSHNGKDYLVWLRASKDGFEVIAKSGLMDRLGPRSRESQKKTFSEMWDALRHLVSLINRKVNKKSRAYKPALEWFNEEATKWRYLHLKDLKPCEVPFAKDPVCDTNYDLFIRLDALDMPWVERKPSH